jgi:hypothetical protein
MLNRPTYIVTLALLALALGSCGGIKPDQQAPIVKSEPQTNAPASKAQK